MSRVRFHKVKTAFNTVPDKKYLGDHFLGKIFQIDFWLMRKKCGLNLFQVMESRMRGKVRTERERE